MTELERVMDVGEVVKEGWQYNDIGRAIDFEYGTWETAEGAAIDSHQREQEASFELAQVAWAVWHREREEGLKRLCHNLPVDARSLHTHYVRPLEGLAHLNTAPRGAMLSRINLTLRHFEIAAPLGVLSPEVQEELLIQADEKGWSSKRLGVEVKKAKKELTSGDGGPLPPPTERLTLIHSAIETLDDHIKPGSVDVIITDPPYPEEYLPVYTDLGRVAAEVLKDGSSAYIMVGQTYLPSIIQMLSEYLTYHWTIAYLTPGGQAVQQFPRKVNAFWKPVLMFTKGEYGGDWLGDVAASNVNDNDKRFHDWGQSESGMLDLVERCSNPNTLVLDPFVGGGATAVAALAANRRFVGADADKKALETTSRRIERLEKEIEE